MEADASFSRRSRLEQEPSGSLRLDWHRSVPEDWDSWVSRSRGASFSVRSGFLDALSVYPPNSEIHILTASRGQKRVGAFPILVERKWGTRWLRSMSFGTYGGPLTLRSENQPEVIRSALIRALGQRMEEDSMVSGQICLPPNGPDSRPDSLLSDIADTVSSEMAQVVDLTDGVESIKKKLKKRTKQGFSRAKREGVVVREEMDALPAVHKLYRQQAREWGVQKPYPLPFLQRLIQHPSRFARLFVARVEDRIQAGVLALSGGGETFVWWSGSGPEARETLAFPYLLFRVLVSAAENGETRLNLGASGGNPKIESFKKSLGAEPRRVWIFRLSARKPNLKTSLVRLALRFRGRG